MSESVLKITNVNKSFGGLKALNNINLNIEKGKVHAIIGPNGAGKSTLLNVCIGLLAPDTGTVEFNGKNIVGKQAHEINQMGLVRVFQTPEIFADLSLLENVMVPALAKRDGSFKFKIFRSLANEVDIMEEAISALDSIGMSDKLYQLAGSMSRGDKRRLELAVCLIQHPKLLLLDEPTAGMARHDTNQTIELLKKIKEGGMAKIIIEHDMHVVFSVADTISVLARGEIIATGTPDEIKGNPVVQEAYLGGSDE
ncbi:ABC transporter, ATP-binding protein 1 (cluster 4, leucine/isoleucine/valine/benzoate) [uncultured Gammaproteobacteria bacterium]|uniref:ABC transporter ATP-binding protein n=1 Tax=Bathymodiolus heckerae thiotrophic gill symbiont TaxID=1052212 RepID=UPI0010BB106C|nr:ABC transporter ATP-binding protein [Bathymodiolus heckerae thiotrophic gill symbiont]CAC9599361.1 ABC transporter, ATP-binding protein 1 (cluster 4, leucine/isoleucine/valine/benzoate) [uncultured Gammaproteobacteria bacterium]CAC9599432.1 ABC transporter, ATP-binding protein 1 (cluster 4, leucine/isoleucine/valine/benzoate) [uncultured Gammaproteobacteria bacterium]SHN92532.1 Branched-chain amino acid transport ATP-binding protein LivG (TC 3.A.1.4.1) [Bathymodiolus heckerae thiotrophic gill